MFMFWFGIGYAEERVGVGPFNQEIANRWRVIGGGTSLETQGCTRVEPTCFPIICCTKLPLTPDFGIFSVVCINLGDMTKEIIVNLNFIND